MPPSSASLGRLASLARQLDPAPAPAAEEAAQAPAKIGGAVLLEPCEPVPPNPREVTAVQPTSGYPPFAKTLSSCGLRLIATADVADDFIAHTGVACAAMLAPGPGIDAALQDAVVEYMHRHRACCPMWKGMEPPAEIESGGMDATAAANSVCDVIIYSVGGQTMEVIEHILHHVTDVGFHFAFPEEWGLDEGSALHEVMMEAVEKGLYEIDSCAHTLCPLPPPPDLAEVPLTLPCPCPATLCYLSATR